MEKFIPYEKLSKKEKKRRDAMKRGSWYGINPVTRKPANSKAYNRRKAGKWYGPTEPGKMKAATFQCLLSSYQVQFLRNFPLFC